MVPLTSLGLAFLAGLLGGAHCVGMCGPFVLAASAGGRPSWTFHLGRVASYAALGALAAAVGSLLVAGGGVAPPRLLRGVVAGALLLLFGAAFAGLLPRRWLEPPAALVRLAALSARGATRAGAAFPLLLGLAVGLLPCGLLYPMYAAAVDSGSPLRGAALLAAFGLGTVPLLGAFSVALDRLGIGARQRLLRAAGVVLLLLGAWTLWRAAQGTALPAHGGSPAARIS